MGTWLEDHSDSSGKIIVFTTMEMTNMEKNIHKWETMYTQSNYIYKVRERVVLIFFDLYK
jgi:hypothetical protein